MAIGDYYRLIDYQTMQGQQIVNVYDFQQTAIYTPVSFTEAQDLVDNFILETIPFLIAAQSEQVVHTLVVAGAYGSFTDFGSSTVVDGTGLVTGGALPSFNAWGYKLQRTTRETRHGSKRIAGVAEAWQQNGVIDTPAVTAVTNLGEQFGAPVPVDETAIFTPVILSLDPITHLPVVSNKIINGIYRGITTQKSRQPGHGS